MRNPMQVLAGDCRTFPFIRKGVNLRRFVAETFFPPQQIAAGISKSQELLIGGLEWFAILSQLIACEN